VKRIYGLSEQQFRNTFERVVGEPGRTGENLLIALESRLDNVVYRMGLAGSRKAARQLVRHRHVEVNGRPVDVPSYQLSPGDEVRLAKASRELDSVAVSLELASKGQPVSWVTMDRSAMTGRVVERPTRDAIPIAAEEQLIVELYSK
jgi:small subunit ribosomal protein S4